MDIRKELSGIMSDLMNAADTMNATEQLLADEKLKDSLKTAADNVDRALHELATAVIELDRQHCLQTGERIDSRPKRKMTALEKLCWGIKDE